ncbi:MAG: hypothetical protein H6909_02965 [Rickettsiaceae bacterium]|nr:hypothetical protein [Rickettsiaceae bacterium]
MFHNNKFNGDIKVFAYNQKPYLIFVKDMSSNTELQFVDHEYFHLLIQNRHLLEPGLLDTYTHPITVLADYEEVSLAYKGKIYYTRLEDYITGKITIQNEDNDILQELHQNINNLDLDSLERFTKHHIIYDPITEDLFATIETSIIYEISCYNDHLTHLE